MENYVVIKEKQLRMLMAQCGMEQHERNEAVLSNTFPAQEMWDACKDCWMVGGYDDRAKIHHEHPTLESFLKTKA